MTDAEKFFDKLWRTIGSNPPYVAPDGTRVVKQLAAVSRQEFEHLITLGFKEEYDTVGCGGDQTRPKVVLIHVEVIPDDGIKVI